MSLAHESQGEYESELDARYDLTGNEMSELTTQLLLERPPVSDDPVICYSIEPDSPYANVARSVECEVFEHYFGNTSDQMSTEYGGYENQSRFFLAIDQEKKRPAGVLRVIENGPNGLKTLNDLETLSKSEEPDVPKISSVDAQFHHSIESLDDTWDVGTVAVRKDYRKDQSRSVQLYRALYVSAMENQVQHFISIIDSKPLEKMTGFLGIPFVPLAGSKPFSYLGSTSSEAVYGHVPEFYESMVHGRWTSVKKLMARTAFRQLVKGSDDQALQL